MSEGSESVTWRTTVLAMLVAQERLVAMLIGTDDYATGILKSHGIATAADLSDHYRELRRRVVHMTAREVIGALEAGVIGSLCVQQVNDEVSAAMILDLNLDPDTGEAFT